jgi:hypothetical protein
LREPPSRELRSAAIHSAAQSSSIEARAARVAALDTAFSVDPTIKKNIYSGDDGEGKYDDTSNEGNKDKDREDDGDEVSGGDDEDTDNGREVGKDEDYVAEDDIDDDNNFYKSSLFDDDDNNSIDDAKYCVPLARGASVGCKPKRSCLDKPNTDGMSEQEAEEVLGKWEKDWKKAQDQERRKSACVITLVFCLICFEP